MKKIKYHTFKSHSSSQDSTTSLPISPITEFYNNINTLLTKSLIFLNEESLTSSLKNLTSYLQEQHQSHVRYLKQHKIEQPNLKASNPPKDSNEEYHYYIRIISFLESSLEKCDASAQEKLLHYFIEVLILFLKYPINFHQIYISNSFKVLSHLMKANYNISNIIDKKLWEAYRHWFGKYEQFVSQIEIDSDDYLTVKRCTLYAMTRTCLVPMKYLSKFISNNLDLRNLMTLLFRTIFPLFENKVLLYEYKASQVVSNDLATWNALLGVVFHIVKCILKSDVDLKEVLSGGNVTFDVFLSIYKNDFFEMYINYIQEWKNFNILSPSETGVSVGDTRIIKKIRKCSVSYQFGYDFDNDESKNRTKLITELIVNEGDSSTCKHWTINFYFFNNLFIVHDYSKTLDEKTARCKPDNKAKNDKLNTRVITFLQYFLSTRDSLGESTAPTEIISDNIIFVKLVKMVVQILLYTNNKDKIEIWIGWIISHFHKFSHWWQTNINISWNTSSFIEKTIKHNKVSNQLPSQFFFDPYLISAFTNVLLEILNNKDPYYLSTYIERCQNIFTFPLQMINEENEWYENICQVSFAYTSKCRNLEQYAFTKINHPNLIENTSKYIQKLIQSSIKISLFTTKNFRNPFCQNINEVLNNLNRDNIHSRCLQIDNRKIKKLICDSYITTSYDDIESSELTNFIQCLSQINLIANSMELSLARFFIFIYNIFKYNYKKSNFIIQLENSFIIKFGWSIIHQNMGKRNNKLLNYSIFYMIINLCEYDKFIAWFRENDRDFLDTICNIFIEETVNNVNPSITIEKIYPMWNVSNYIPLLQKVECFNRIGLRIWVQIGNVLNNKPYKLITCTNLFDDDDHDEKNSEDQKEYKEHKGLIVDIFTREIRWVDMAIERNKKNGYEIVLMNMVTWAKHSKVRIQSELQMWFTPQNTRISKIWLNIHNKDKDQDKPSPNTYWYNKLWKNENYSDLLWKMLINLTKKKYTQPGGLDLHDFVDEIITEYFNCSGVEAYDQQISWTKELENIYETFPFTIMKYVHNVWYSDLKSELYWYIKQGDFLMRQYQFFINNFTTFYDWLFKEQKQWSDEYEYFSFSELWNEKKNWITNKIFEKLSKQPITSGKQHIWSSHNNISSNPISLNGTKILKHEETVQNTKMRSYSVSTFLRWIHTCLKVQYMNHNQSFTLDGNEIKLKMKKQMQNTNTFKKLLLMVDSCVNYGKEQYFNNCSVLSKFWTVSAIVLNEELIFCWVPFLCKVMQSVVWLNEFCLLEVESVCKLLMKVIKLNKQDFVFKTLFFADFTFLETIVKCYLHVIVLQREDIDGMCHEREKYKGENAKICEGYNEILFHGKLKWRVLFIIKFYLRAAQTIKNRGEDISTLIFKCINNYLEINAIRMKIPNAALNYFIQEWIAERSRVIEIIKANSIPNEGKETKEKKRGNKAKETRASSSPSSSNSTQKHEYWTFSAVVIVSNGTRETKNIFLYSKTIIITAHQTLKNDKNNRIIPIKAITSFSYTKALNTFSWYDNDSQINYELTFCGIPHAFEFLYLINGNMNLSLSAKFGIFDIVLTYDKKSELLGGVNNIKTEIIIKDDNIKIWNEVLAKKHRMFAIKEVSAVTIDAAGKITIKRENKDQIILGFKDEINYTLCLMCWIKEINGKQENNNISILFEESKDKENGRVINEYIVNG